jgi:Transcriptional regulators
VDVEFKPMTSGEHIYQSLRASILALEILPGQELKTEEWTERFRVSRSPVRDAFMRLNKDGLVDVFPQRGTRVSLIDLRRVREERFLRKSLEDHAIVAFLQKDCEDALKKMQGILKEQKHTEKSGDLPAFLRLDDAFHGQLFSAIEMDFCFDLIRERCVHYRRIRILTFKDPNVIPHIIAEHEALLNALKDRNVDLAASIDRRHLSKLKQEQEQLLKQFPDYFLN